MYCPNCGTVAKPKKVTKGSFLIEVFLWLLFIIPGVIYSLWRLTTKAEVCPKCGAPNMIPSDSPKALQAFNAAKKPRRTSSRSTRVTSRMARPNIARDERAKKKRKRPPLKPTGLAEAAGLIAVNDSLLMCMLDRMAHRDEECDALSYRQAFGVAVTSNRDAIDQLHHEVGQTRGGRPGVEHTRDVGVIHYRQSLTLAFKPRDYLLAVHARLDDLERHVGAERMELLGVIHHAHPAFP